MQKMVANGNQGLANKTDGTQCDGCQVRPWLFLANPLVHKELANKIDKFDLATLYLAEELAEESHRLIP